MPFPRTLRSALLIPAVSALLATQGTAQKPGVQTIPLQAGWNLVAFQVDPVNPAPSAVFGNLGGNFKAAFTYDAGAKRWTSYQNPSTPGLDAAANTLPGVAMDNIQLGKGYWVWVGNAAPGWAVSGTIPALTPGVPMRPGWNLIGVPTGAVSLTERVGLLAVMTRAGFNYDQILKWEASASGGSYKTAATLKPDGLTSLQGDQEMRFFDPAAGYWVDMTNIEPALLQPKLNVTLRPDFNLEPYAGYPGKEDISISGADLPKTAVNQTHIKFLPGEDVQTLSLSNTGGGILIWNAVFAPDHAPSMTVPWLTLSSSPSAKVELDNTGKPAREYKELNGVTTVENDIIFLRLDRKNLPVGTYTGKLKLASSVGNQEWSVTATVPPIEGEFRGLAQIDSVKAGSGPARKNKVPDIDLAVSLYGDLKVSSLIRGFIDSRHALLWPYDVPLAGYYQSSEGNAFQLSGGFILPPGDQNYEPYDTLAGKLATDRDVDWNDDGKVDATNPLPYPIQRSVFLKGALATGDPMNGYEIKGQYTEVIHGMMKEAITLEGTFSIRREKPSAFETRASSLGAAGVDTPRDHLNQKVWSGPAFPLTPNTAVTRDIALSTEMELRSLSLSLNWGTFPAAGTEHGNFLIKLLAPLPEGSTTRPELVIYDSTQSAAGWETLKELTFPENRPTEGDLDAFLRDLTKTAGTWTLSILNRGTTVNLTGWSLRFFGQPVFDVYGVVRDANGGVISGADVSLSGQPLAGLTQSAADGSFVLRRVPGMPLNLTASHSAYTANTAGLAAGYLLPGLTGNTPKETALLSRFQPLAGLPASGMGVPGFTLGGAAGTASALPLVMTPVSSDPGIRMITSPGTLPAAAGISPNPRGYILSWGAVSVDMQAVNAGANPSVRWAFGDGTTASTVSASHTYTDPKTHALILESPPGTPVDRVQVIVMPTPGHVPANIREVDSSYPGNPPNYTTFCFNPSFTGGGVLPAGVTLPTSGSSTVSASGAKYVDLAMLQHTHSASFDLDLAPLAAVNALFSSDNFDTGSLFSSHVSNKALTDDSNDGFEQEDHNYTLRQAPKRLPTASQPNPPLYPPWVVEDAQLGLTVPVWTDQGWSVEDATRHPIKRVSALGSTATDATERYVMTCSIGAAVSPYGLTVQAVEASDTYDAVAVRPSAFAQVEPTDSGLARNLHFRLITGPLAFFHGQPLRKP